MDALPHSILFLLGPNEDTPLPVPSQHLLPESYLEPNEGRSSPQLRRCYHDLLLEEWGAQAPDPARYPYCPSLKPLSLMGLNKFDAGQLHQMRSGKGYLRAHPS